MERREETRHPKRKIMGVRGREEQFVPLLLCTFLVVCSFILGFAVNPLRKILFTNQEVSSPLETIHSSSTVSSVAPCKCNSSSSVPSPLSPSKPCNCNGSSVPIIGFKDCLSPKNVWHELSDEELLWRASMIPLVEEYPFRRTPKVAFLFLSKGRLPFAPLWDKFFKGHENFFSVYHHPSPDFKEEIRETSAFYGRRIPSKFVSWGKLSMIDAEKRLLANALLDMSNERFVLLSESCIPLYNFTTIYNYIINSEASFLNLFYQPGPPGQGRYNPEMAPEIDASDWRKGGQWFELQRKLAIAVVADRKYYRVFEDHCNLQCIADEHYIPTLVYKTHPLWTSNRSLTWTNWDTTEPHPKTFGGKNITLGFLNWVRNDHRGCLYNGKNINICFLFARKFDESALEPLLQMKDLLG